MKKYISCFLILTSALSAFSQTKTKGVTVAPSVIDFSDTTIPDFNPQLHNVDVKTIPSAEYANKKEILHKKRMEYLKKKENLQKGQLKSAQENEIEPKIDLGFQANIPNGHPADNDVAVSNDLKVISAVNSNILVSDSTGKKIIEKSLTNLVAQAGVFNSTSDPRVIYDPKEDRFIFTCFSGNLSKNSVILVGFSKTNDPAGAWNFYKLNGNSFNDSTWSDYPIISVSNNDLFITFNQVKDNVHWSVGFKQSVIWQIDKNTGYKGDSLKYDLWSDIKHNGVFLRNICPAKYQTNDLKEKMYFLSVKNVSFSNDTIFLLEITNSYKSKSAKLNQTILKSPIKYGFPPNALQKKNSFGITQQLMTNDARVLTAIYENDHIHFGSNSINPKFQNAAVFLGSILNVSKNPKVEAKLLSDEDLEFGYPSMSHIGLENRPRQVLYTFSHCFTDSFPGTSMVYQNAKGEFSKIVSVKNGNNRIDMVSDSIERWGDYTNIQKVYNQPNVAFLTGSFGGPLGNSFTRMLSWVSKVRVEDTTTLSSSVSNVLKESQQIQIAPNPAKNVLSFQFELQETQILSFEIWNLEGKKIYHIYNQKAFQGQNNFQIQIDQMPAGNYFLKINGNNGFEFSERFNKY
jgi:hypothetical protein